MAEKWLRWLATIDYYGKIHFPSEAQNYLSSIKRYCKGPWDMHKELAKVKAKRVSLKIVHGSIKNFAETVIEAGTLPEDMVYMDVNLPKKPVSKGRELYVLGVIIQREKYLTLKKGRYMILCPYFALHILLSEIYASLENRNTIFFKGNLALFDKSNRVYVPAEFQEIIGIDSYKNSREQKNIVIRPPGWKLPEFKGSPHFGYWLEIWNKKDLER